MKKILWYSDSPAIESGFAQVAKQILAALHATGKYEIEVIGVEHFMESYDKAKYPYTIHPVADPVNDRYQSELFTKALKEWDFDILFTFHNLGFISQFAKFIEDARRKKKFKWINYSPIDNATIQPNEILPIVLADVPVVYTEFGKAVVAEYRPDLKDKLKVIYHGCEPEEFKPLDNKAELKKNLFNLEPGTFLVTNVNRNQWRKHLAATMVAFKLFKNTTKADAKLYLHCKADDHGGDITRQAMNIGLDLKEDLIISPIDDESMGVPRETMNEIYNASDVVVTSTLGEGWGLSTTEAMAAKVPFVGPENSSIVEIIGQSEQRGYLYKMTDQWIIPYGHANIPYFLPHIPHMAAKIIEVYEALTKKGGQRKHLELKLQNAREWTEKNTWAEINKQWLEVFDA